MLDGSDVEAEELRIADLSALHPAGVAPVPKEHQFHRGAHPQCDDGEVDAPRSNCGQAEHDTEGDGSHHSDK